MDKKDCFAYKDRGKCSALRVMDCEDCKFYKSSKQVKEERKIYPQCGEY